MYKIFLLIFIIKSVSSVSDDESYEKYIDLLPEKEKQEFLDRIARRLLEEIKTEDVPNQSHVEINDDQLETHDSFVQDIMKEETDNLKDEKLQDNSKDDKLQDNSKDEKLQDNLEKYDRKFDVNRSEERHIDLTLREGKREERKDGVPDSQIETTSEFDYSVIPVKTIYDDVDTIKERPFESIKQDELKVAKQRTDNKSSVKNDQSHSDIIDFHDSFNNKDENSSKLSTTEPELKQSTNKNGTAIEDINSKIINQSSNENIDVTMSTVITEMNENVKGGNDNSSEYNIKSSTSEAENKSTAILISTNTETTISPIQENKNESVIGNLENNNKHSSKGDEINTSIEMFLTDVNLTTISSPPLTTTDIFKTSESEAFVENRVQNSTNRNVKFIAIRKSKLIKDINVRNKEYVSKENILQTKTALRLRSDSIIDKKAIESHKKYKEYEVYEIAAEKPPFILRDRKKVNKQPNYVPVYNYAPENAYFRPYDRFGPNDDNIKYEATENNDYNDRESNLEVDTNIKLRVPSTRSRFVGYNKKQDRPFRINDNNLNIINNEKSGIYGFMKPVHKNVINRNINYNPYDYLDMDYGYNIRSILRKNVKQFPDSHEADHPYNSIQKSNTVKDHIRAVRQLLYLQNKFGYVPDVKDKGRKFNQINKTPKLVNKHVRFKSPLNNNIAVDYYFGRVNSKEHEDNVLKDNESQNKTDKDIELKDLITDSKKFHNFFNAMLQVLEDMVRFDNEDLEQYSWLLTTVDIQTAIRKLLDLSEGLLYGENVHPKDKELLKYCLYLLKSSKLALNIQNNDKLNFRVKSIKNTKSKKKPKGLLPHNRNRGKIQQPLKLWKDFAKFIRKEAEKKDSKLTILYDFEDFLQSILFHLNEFHDAIKYIAMITKFENQSWFKDLKRIYFNGANKRQLAKVVLHISLVNLLESIEEDAVNGAEGSFKDFVKNNLEAVRRTRDKFLFVLRVMDELRI